MKITWKNIEDKKPCAEALTWGREKYNGIGEIERVELIKNLISEGRIDWANWIITRLMSHNQQVKYAIFAAEQVIGIYEKRCPKDDRPRKAIQAAEDYLAGKIDKKASAYAADAAAYSAKKKMKLKILDFGITLLREEPR